MSAAAAVSITSVIPVIQTEHPDSRFTLLKATTKGSEGELQADKVVALCLSYTPLTLFSSIPRFLHYFQDKNVLPLSADQPLVIQDLSLLFRLQTEDPDIVPDGVGKRCLFILNKILALVAKQGVFKVEGGECSGEISLKELSIQFSSDVTFEAQPGFITIRPKHLFRMMDAYGVSHLSFGPNQALQFVGVTEADQHFETPDVDNLTKWVRYAPKGCKINWKLKKGLFSCSRGQIDSWYGITQPQRAFVIQAIKGMTLSLIRPLALVAVPTPPGAVSVVRLTEEMVLKEDFSFHDTNAIVVIDQNLTGIGRKVSIVARNVIICPHARVEVGELVVNTTGAALLLNVTAKAVRLTTKGDAVLGNSRITSTNVNSGKAALVFGLNWHTAINLRDHQAAIVSVLQDAIPLEAHRLLSALSPTVGRLKAPEAP